MGCEYAVVGDALFACPEYLVDLYQSWVVFLFVAAPACTFGVALSFFKNLVSHIQYRTIYRNRDVYVFSEINERSVALARSIKENNDKSGTQILLVFTDVFEAKDEESFELMNSVKQLGAICFKDDILVIDFAKHSAKKSLSFFTIGKNQNENLNQTIKLIERYKERENTNLYFFSTSMQSEMLFSSLDKGKIKARRINEVRSLVNRVLYDHGEKFFNVESEGEDGTKLISAMIVGMGQHGTEMAKALTWFCQMDGYSFEINGFDKDPLAEEKFKQIAPALFTSEYRIKIHSNCDVDTDKFGEAVKKLKNTSYVLVSLGDDDRNIKTAVYLRMCFERIGIKPVIQAIVNTHNKNVLQGIKNFKNQEYKIDFIGDLETSYSEDVIVNSALEDEALAVHLLYSSNPEDFWSFEYNYRSSTATAIHNRAKCICNIPGIMKTEDERTEEERLNLQKLEHRRWNAYMHSEGYVFSEKRNDLAKTHNNITHFDALDKEIQEIDSRVAAAPPSTKN
ncbi:MAG: hypothetical protein J6S71_02440 [Clostridia bacterium]|nr:hypothetical protein [Clostridia bacterium]